MVCGCGRISLRGLVGGRAWGGRLWLWLGSALRARVCASVFCVGVVGCCGVLVLAGAAAVDGAPLVLVDAAAGVGFAAAVGPGALAGAVPGLAGAGAVVAASPHPASSAEATRRLSASSLPTRRRLGGWVISRLVGLARASTGPSHRGVLVFLLFLCAGFLTG